MKKFKFHVGQVVNFTNDNGVNWGNRTITEAVDEGYGNAYRITPHDAPWFAVPERCFKEVK